MKPPITQWKIATNAVFTKPPAGAEGHLRIYCGPACVAIIPIADQSEEATKRAIQTAEFLAESVNHGVTAYGLSLIEVAKIQRGEKIQAIKSLRGRLNCGLREAKQLIDDIISACGIRVLTEDELEAMKERNSLVEEDALAWE